MKLCLAGLKAVYMESRPILREVPYMLESFYYVSDFQIPLINTADLFLLDSGAFTFMNGQKGHPNWDDYINRYIRFINENDAKYFFELDIDSVVGYEQVKQIRARIERETMKKSIPVWHKSRGIDEWKRLVNDYDYIAIGGIVTGEIKKDEYHFMRKMVEYAYDRGVKVHGLGFSTQDIGTYKFYSADSTSWNSVRFGQVFKFTGEKIVNIAPSTVRLNPKKIAEIQRHNIREWVKYQKYLNRSCRD